ncbi:hypothetical protein EV424DRAFT_1347048 [Suillus variegatus]|nr:hypothetical protein EV424DRAFT_1347048 [Suillus variegatus]
MKIGGDHVTGLQQLASGEDGYQGHTKLSLKSTEKWVTHIWGKFLCHLIGDRVLCSRFGMSTMGSDIPVLLMITMNTLYKPHSQFIDSVVDAALGNMRGHGATSLDIEAFAF